MIRGTTPTLEFTIPFDTDLLAEVWVTLSQNNEILIDKHLEDCSREGNLISVKLTQEETLELDCDCITEIQLRVKTREGEALASDIMTVDTHRILKEGVI